MKPSLEKKLGKVTYNEQVIELSGISDEWQPNPTWWDIKTILENDTREYAHKAIYLLKDLNDVQTIYAVNAAAYATSDGAFYELSNVYTIKHTWDKSKDKPCFIDGKEMYRTRYVIVYTNSSKEVGLYTANNNSLLYLYSQPMSESNYTKTEFLRCFNLEAIEGDVGVNRENKSTSSRFSSCLKLEKVPEMDLSIITNTQSMFSYCQSIKEISIDASSATSCGNMFQDCIGLEKIQLNLPSCTSSPTMFSNCVNLRDVQISSPQKITNCNGMFRTCRSLEYIDDFNVEAVTSLDNIFYDCFVLKSSPKNMNTSNATGFGSMFYSCYCLEDVYNINLMNATNTYNMFYYCYMLKNLFLKNIKIGLKIGSGTSWGHLLTLDSLLNTIKELWDNTSGTSTLTLTVSTPSKTLLQNTYVKLVDITDEMRAEDEYIDNKKPFVVCESTDEGAMTAEEYVISKNWQLA